jgi:hypothetical protein
MVDIRPSALPAAILPLRTGDAVIVDQGADGVRQTNPISFTDSVAPVATQSEAQTGSDNTKRMTPLRTKQSIASEVGVTLASNSQGAKADSAVQTVNGKSGNSVTLVKGDVGLGNVDNTSDANKPISTATQAALNLKANDSEVVKSVNGVFPVSGNVTVSAEEKRLQDTRTTAIAESFANNVQFVETAGYSSVGDGGGALYKRVTTEPPHAGKFQSADGAWWELMPPFNICQFGAVPDNTTDSTSAIQKCLDAAHAKLSGTVTAPAGTFVISDTLYMPQNSKVMLRGAGISATCIRQIDPTKGGIRVENTLFTALGGGIHDMSFEAGAGLLSGGFFGSGSAGTGVELIRPNDGFSVHNVGSFNFDTAFAEAGGWNARYTNILAMFFRYSGFLVTKSGTVVGGSSILTDAKISNNGYTGAVQTDAKGIEVRSSGGFMFTNIDVTSTYNGISVKPASGDQVAYLFFQNVLADTTIGDGWVLDGTAGAVAEISGSLCWAGYCSGAGMVTKGANLDGVTMNNMALRQNEGRGWHHQGGFNVSLSGGRVTGNSRGNSLSLSGIEIDSGVVDWKISDCRIGNFANGGLVTQGDGIRINSGADYGVVVGNKCNGAKPGYAGVNNMSIAPDIIVANNQS